MEASDKWDDTVKVWKVKYCQTNNLISPKIIFKKQRPNKDILRYKNMRQFVDKPTCLTKNHSGKKQVTSDSNLNAQSRTCTHARTHTQAHRASVKLIMY